MHFGAPCLQMKEILDKKKLHQWVNDDSLMIVHSITREIFKWSPNLICQLSQRSNWDVVEYLSRGVEFQPLIFTFIILAGTDRMFWHENVCDWWYPSQSQGF